MFSIEVYASLAGHSSAKFRAMAAIAITPPRRVSVCGRSERQPHCLAGPMRDLSRDLLEIGRKRSRKPHEVGSVVAGGLPIKVNDCPLEAPLLRAILATRRKLDAYPHTSSSTTPAMGRCTNRLTAGAPASRQSASYAANCGT